MNHIGGYHLFRCSIQPRDVTCSIIYCSGNLDFLLYCKQSSWSGPCMSSPSPLHRLATESFDERYKRKQSESFLSQPEHTISVSRHRTLWTQYLHLCVFLWKQYIILAIYKDFCKLSSFWLFTPLLTNIVFLFRHLPTEIAIFNCYRLLPNEVFHRW